MLCCRFQHSLTVGYQDDSSSSDLDDDDASGLPFPEPISRSSFLGPDFDPAVFLSSLRNRHQTLEDLRQELRRLGQTLNKELLDLVNQNYRDFLSLGSSLHGGDEKIEEVRVELLSFKRDVQAIRDAVDSRRKEIQLSLKEKKRLREEANVGRSLLDFADRVDELEQRLMIKNAPPNDSNSDLSDTDVDVDDDADATGDASIVSIKKLEHHIQKYLYLTTLAARIGNDHPFLLSQRSRMAKIRSVLALDLKTALEQTKHHAGDKRDIKTLTVLRLYNLLGEDVNTVSQFKNLRL